MRSRTGNQPRRGLGRANGSDAPEVWRRARDLTAKPELLGFEAKADGGLRTSGGPRLVGFGRWRCVHGRPGSVPQAAPPEPGHVKEMWAGDKGHKTPAGEPVKLAAEKPIKVAKPAREPRGPGPGAGGRHRSGEAGLPAGGGGAGGGAGDRERSQPLRDRACPRGWKEIARCGVGRRGDSPVGRFVGSPPLPAANRTPWHSHRRTLRAERGAITDA